MYLFDKQVIKTLLLVILVGLLICITGCDTNLINSIEVVKNDDLIDSNANLQSLQINTGNMQPAFSKDITEYTIAVSPKNENIEISALAEDDFANITIANDTTGIEHVSNVASMYLSPGKNTIKLTVSAEDAIADTVYTLTVNRNLQRQQAYIKAFNADVDDNFSRGGIAASGNTLVVSAFYEDSGSQVIDSGATDNSSEDAGAVYVYVKNDTTWSLQAYLKPDDAAAGDWFGHSISIEGDILVVGAPRKDNPTNSGSVYVFKRTGSIWAQEAVLKASNAGIGDQFGFCVALSSETLVVGANQEKSISTIINQGDAD